jgi:3-oxoacyl-[acyl-carrier protein] reductase
VDLGLTDRPALVAAASKGLGKASALALAEEGARVAICARDRGALEAARDEIAERTGAEVAAIPADVGTEEGAVGFVRRGVEALGGCQVLVANAGGPPTGTFDELADDDFRDAFELNFLSTVRMTREALPHMREAGYGRVVAIVSLAVKQPRPGLMLSNAVRAAVMGWARTLVDEVASDGITVNAVLPGRFSTDRIRALHEDRARRAGATVEEMADQDAAAVPLRRIGDPKELGDVVAFLASERASFVTGCFAQVDGGMYRGLL